MNATTKRKLGRTAAFVSFLLWLLTVALWLWTDHQTQARIAAAEAQGYPAPDGPAVKPLRSLVIRVDSVEFIDDIGDTDGNGELTLHTLAVRPHNRSGKLSYPHQGAPLIVYPQMEIPLSQYALQIENIEPDEPIYVYFLAQDEDTTSALEGTLVSDIALDVAVESMELLLENGAGLPYTDFSGFFASQYVSNLAQWWREADLIGVYRVRLDPDDFGRIDRAYDEVSVEGNMHIKFAILSGYTSQEVPVTREVEVTRLAQVTREVSVTREVEVTRQVPALREVAIGPVTEVEVTRVVPILQQVGCEVSAPQTTRCEAVTAVSVLQAVQPVHGEYQNPITFRWNGTLQATYKVILTHAETGVRHESEWIQDVRWDYDIPKEEFGNWQWQVVDGYGRQSAQGTFVFNPHPMRGGR